MVTCIEVMSSLKDFEICGVLMTGTSFEEISSEEEFGTCVLVVKIDPAWETCDRKEVGIFGVNMEISAGLERENDAVNVRLIFS